MFPAQPRDVIGLSSAEGIPEHEEGPKVSGVGSVVEVMVVRSDREGDYGGCFEGKIVPTMVDTSLDSSQHNPQEYSDEVDGTKQAQHCESSSRGEKSTEKKLQWVRILCSHCHGLPVLVMRLVNPVHLWVVQQSMAEIKETVFNDDEKCYLQNRDGSMRPILEREVKRQGSQ